MSECVGLRSVHGGSQHEAPACGRTHAAAGEPLRLARAAAADHADHDLEEIHTSAKKHLELFTHASGMKNPSKEFQQVESIVQAVHVQDHEMEQRTLQSLGVTPMWVDSVKDAQAKLADLVSGAF